MINNEVNRFLFVTVEIQVFYIISNYHTHAVTHFGFYHTKRYTHGY